MRVRKRIYILLLIVSGILCLAMFATERVTDQYVLTQISKMNLYDFLFVFLCLIGVGAISLLIHFWRKITHKFYKGLLIFGWVGLIGVMMVGSLIWFGNYAVTTWYEFYSQDNKHSLVIEESTFLRLSDICLYERTSPIFVRKLKADLSPDDGWRHSHTVC